MKLYHFNHPLNYNFAQAHREDVRITPTDGPSCRVCGADRTYVSDRMQLAWEPGSDVVGDFTFPSFNWDLIITERVRDVLAPVCPSLVLLPFEMVQDPKVRRPTRITKRTRPRIWLPYEGPPLWYLRTPSWCHLDLPASGVRIISECSTCGKIQYKDDVAFEDRHMVVDPTTWDGAPIFRVVEAPAWNFCTPAIVELVQEHGFTNVSFREDGVIPEPTV
ncbi:MAG: hypothetical protein ACKVVP_07810 [Chloroflexota bacterium]